MLRANRHYLPGHLWYLMHRCHSKQLLLKFLEDRRIWIDWTYAAGGRLGLFVLD